MTGIGHEAARPEAGGGAREGAEPGGPAPGGRGPDGGGPDSGGPDGGGPDGGGPDRLGTGGTAPGSRAALPSVANSALHETVVEALRQAIAQGKFAPGEHLRETELADAMQVSRGPIREALTQLEREGLVELRRHRGAQVVELSRADVEEVYTLRMALERLAVRRAAKFANAEHFAEMDGVLDQMTELDDDYESKRAASLDVAFHDIIYRAANHGRLYRSWQQISSQVYVFLYSRSVAIHDFNDIAFEHGEIRDLLARRDADGAVRAIESHLDGAYRRLLGSFEKGD